MDFRTQIELPVGLPPITHAGQILMMGSCFVQNIGNFLKDAKFQLDLNPWYSLQPFFSFCCSD